MELLLLLLLLLLLSSTFFNSTEFDDDVDEVDDKLDVIDGAREDGDVADLDDKEVLKENISLSFEMFDFFSERRLSNLFPLIRLIGMKVLYKTNRHIIVINVNKIWKYW